MARASRVVGVQLPLTILRLVLQRQWTHLAVGDVLQKVCGSSRHRSKTLDSHMVKHLVGDNEVLEFNAGAILPYQPHISFDARMFTAAANLIRGTTPAAGDDAIPAASILAWLDDMSDHAGFGLDQLKLASRSSEEWRTISRDGRGCTPFAMQSLIRSILLCGHLRGDTSLGPAVSQVGNMLGFADDWLEESKAALPSKSTLQRHRFTVDAALSICVRNTIEAIA